MSEATYNTIEDELIGGLQELLDAPPPTQTYFDAESDYEPRRKKRRRRTGENAKPTALQIRYQRQLREARQNRPDLVDDMSKLVAWTWIPGRDRKDCPPIVDLRDPRLLVMDRLGPERGGRPSSVGLTMYRPNVTERGVAVYGAPGNVELYKDFSIRPHFRAGGLCLDSRNEEVFRAGLALDQAIELAARGKSELVETFAPPPVLFGFPLHIFPNPEWRAPMQEEVLRRLHPDTPVLRCLLSPGGRIKDIVDTHDNFRMIHIEREGTLRQIKVPVWIQLHECVQVGHVVAEGQPLGDLPRGIFVNLKAVTSRYPFKTLDWLERRILDELTEEITLDELVFDKATKARVPRKTTWRCVPARYVQTQMSRAVRHLLDFRSHLGRKSHTIDSFECDVWKEEPNQVRVDVMRLDSLPTATDLKFGVEPGIKGAEWFADLLAMPESAPWAPKVPQAGPSILKLERPQTSVPALRLAA
jgi:hypothetical protein